MKKAIIATALLLTLGQIGFSQNFDKTKLDTYFNTLEQNNKFMGSVAVSKNGNTLIAQRTGQPAFPLEATDKDKFKSDQIGAKFEFNPTVKTMTLFQGGGQIKFTKE